MLKILNQPFPLVSKTEDRVIIALAFGAFIFLFLVIFRPFGLQQLGAKHLAFAAFFYGSICFIVLILCLIFVRKLVPSLFVETKWTVWKDILHNIGLILAGTAANILFTHFYFNAPLDARLIFTFFGITLSITVIPIAIIVLLKQIWLMRIFAGQAAALNQLITTRPDSSDLIRFVAENEKENFTLPSDQFLYVEAADNYIRIFFLSDGKPAQKMIRCSMKKMEETLQEHDQLYRCHRTYIVNLQKVVHLTGNAQGYKLKLEAVEELIPVSRSLNKEIAWKLSKV